MNHEIVDLILEYWYSKEKGDSRDAYFKIVREMVNYFEEFPEFDTYLLKNLIEYHTILDVVNYDAWVYMPKDTLERLHELLERTREKIENKTFSLNDFLTDLTCSNNWEYVYSKTGRKDIENECNPTEATH